ncbi:cysteine desulfurase NifS [Zymomonas mobilis]|uniref:Cysteine desulfurase n=1 Tax=Zymomonas mobilis subsp. pomaceae (strain ATCC 29192 / DSM 22645 / JCM 10191 / CCUG 17912 / NBRC 13757 / NCIMB 11200 / NRRL B-4491 / Barker I) TaxID=579138 RepID=F8EUP5_ZYMMT|nr:cysteine desulfurase NifS [Zymomonas mobilis]AEI38191.1 cysteine desulfurase NifS [Zymomonas mobilis subsp. pomaceae ATCC 29192]MDX5947881.1 cysteine desulfurase NifS [Zymomonas mobilis subsp. pomaceae]GEB89955.1 cysteine desulfurase NifS [Zymomonas mobilis subsp. pomaceae]
MRSVYLDNNATTRVDPEVVAAMLPFFTENFGNPSSLHHFGTEAKTALRSARQHLQNLLGAAFEQEIIYTSGGTESDNTAILSALAMQPDRDEIITSAVEHPAILSLCAWLKKNRGIKVHYIPVKANGHLDIEAYRAALSPRTALVSFMWANNETGVIFPIAQLSKIAREAGALFHTDAVQAVGKIAIDLKNSDIDMLSLSGHKLHGPKGIGALYVRKGIKIQPLIRGGHQERGRRGGTENMPAIVGLGVTAQLTAAHLSAENAYIQPLRDRLEQGLLHSISNSMVIGDKENRLSNTLNIAFEHIEGEAILTFLNKAGIAASSGSACASGSMEPSHVLRAMKVPYMFAHGAIRFSFSRDNTEEDVDYVLSVMPAIINNFKKQR